VQETVRQTAGAIGQGAALALAAVLRQSGAPQPDSAAIGRLIAANGWPLLLAEAERHEVGALLSWRLERIPGMPPAFLDALRVQFAASAQRALGFTSELLRVLGILKQAGVHPVPFKGPVLAWSFYETPALRNFGDLDLLLRPEEVSEAVRALQADGFVSEFAADQRLYSAYRHLPMERRGAVVELHWALMPGGHPFGEGLDNMLQRLVSVTIAGRPVPSLSAEDLLPYLCIHGCKHAWASLKWVCDIERVVTSAPVPWSRLWERAAAEGFARHLSVGLLLARDLLGADLPAAATAGVDPVASKFAASLRWERQPTRADEVIFQLRCAAGLKQKLRVGSSFLRPTPTDSASHRLPFYPAYFLRRAARVLVCQGLTLAGWLWRRLAVRLSGDLFAGPRRSRRATAESPVGAPAIPVGNAGHNA
jgi:hypothetical protein